MHCNECGEEVSAAEYIDDIEMCEFCAEAMDEKQQVDNYWFEESVKYNDDDY